MSLTPEAPPVKSGESKPDSSPTTASKGVSHRRHSHHRPWYRRLRRRLGHIPWVRLIIIVVVAIAVGAVAGTALILDSMNRVQASLVSFQRVEDTLSNRSGTDLTLTDFNRLDSSVTDLLGTISAARSRLRFLRPFARLNNDLDSSLTGLDAAEDLTTAAYYMLNGLQPTLFFLVAGESNDSVVTQISSGERIVELLSVGRGQFVTADAYLSAAKESIDYLNQTVTSSGNILNVQQLIKYQDELSQINGALLNAPDFLTSALGISGPKNYLVLSQNSDELRPSGGYISTWGWMTVRNSRVTDYGYSPTTSTSPNPPPADMASQVNVPSWWIRYNQPLYAGWDGSWYADFPSTARMSIWYYNSGSNPKSPADGVVAIDITGFESLLGVIGSVSVPGYNVTVTPDNFRTVIYDIRDYGGGDIPHKRFLVALYQEIFNQWQTVSLDPTKNTQLLGALLQALQEKHIMLYFTDEQLEKALDLLGWSGAQLPATNNDYFMVADANLGNKSNHSIIRSITYDADIQSDGSINGRATVAYDYSAHTAASDPAVNPEFNGPADYGNLAQIFVPLGTTLSDATNVSGTANVVNNDENTEFVARLLVPFDTSQRFQFTYHVPPILENVGSFKRYRLLLQKQPGTPANAVSVQVLLPPNATVVSSSPDPDADYFLDRPILEFRTDLSVDRWIEVIFQD